MSALVLLILVSWVSYWLGRAVMRAAGLTLKTWIEDLTWHTGMGLGLAGLILAGLGMTALLYRGVIAALSVAGAVAGIVICWRRDRTNRRRRHCGSVVLGQVGLVTAGLVCGGASLAGALAPPTAGDAMCYHLELPKVFLAQHSMSYLPDSDNSTYPMLMEMLFLWGLALQGGVLAQLMHWLAGMLLAGATVVLAKRVAGKSVAWSAGAVVLLVPGVTNEMTAPLNDVGLALFTTLAAAAVLQGMRTDERRWFAVGGLCLGMALGVKLLAGLFALAVLMVVLIGSIAFGAGRSGNGRLATISTPGLVCGIAIVIGGWWYARAAFHTGNPVYPFLGHYFGSGRADALPARKRPLGAGDVLGAPWVITMHPERFGGRSHQLGAMFLAILPGVALLRCNRRLRWLGAIAAVYIVLWYLLRQNLRFLFPVVPLLSVAAAVVLVDRWRFGRGPGWVMVACTGMLTMLSVAISLHRVRDRVGVVLGTESAEAYLARQEPTFRVAQHVNEHLSKGALILSQDHRAFYFQRPIVRENVYRRRTGYDSQLKGTDDAAAALRQRGFTHALLAEGVGAGVPKYDATLPGLLRRSAGAVRTIFEHQFRAREGGVVRYWLVEL